MGNEGNLNSVFLGEGIVLVGFQYVSQMLVVSWFFERFLSVCGLLAFRCDWFFNSVILH